jgi:alkylhydroperoxidase/carboxymuconolactone decarboxylase family protein YurZ
MTPDQIQLLRRLALNDSAAVHAVMSGELQEEGSLDPRTAALVRIAILLGVDSDPATFMWAVELAVAAGVDDVDLFNTLVAAAPIIGTARLTAALPHFMAALELEVVEG